MGNYAGIRAIVSQKIAERLARVLAKDLLDKPVYQARRKLKLFAAF